MGAALENWVATLAVRCMCMVAVIVGSRAVLVREGLYRTAGASTHRAVRIVESHDVARRYRHMLAVTLFLAVALVYLCMIGWHIAAERPHGEAGYGMNGWCMTAKQFVRCNPDSQVRSHIG